MKPEELQEAVSKGLEPMSAEVKKVGDSVKGLEERIVKIEALPLTKMSAPFINTIPQTYKGRKLSKQAIGIRSLLGKNVGFDSLDKEEKIDEFCKFMIDVISKTTLNETTAAQGAYLVPDEFQWDIIQLARNRSYALQLARVFAMSSDNLYLPAELTLPSVAWKSESTQLTQSDPTFDQVNLQAKKLTAYSAMTNELLADGAVDVVGLLTEQFAYSMGIELDNQMINGTGDPVSGLGTAACGYSTVTSGASMSTVTTSDLSEAISNIEQGLVGNARWLIGRLAMHYVRSLKTTDGIPLFQYAGAQAPSTIYEFPYGVTEKIANTDGSSKLMAIFGNFNYFYLGRRSGAMSIEANPYSRFDYDETQFRMITRWGLAIAKSAAFARIVTA